MHAHWLPKCRPHVAFVMPSISSMTSICGAVGAAGGGSPRLHRMGTGAASHTQLAVDALAAHSSGNRGKPLERPAARAHLPRHGPAAVLFLCRLQPEGSPEPRAAPRHLDACFYVHAGGGAAAGQLRGRGSVKAGAGARWVHCTVWSCTSVAGRKHSAFRRGGVAAGCSGAEAAHRPASLGGRTCMPGYRPCLLRRRPEVKESPSCSGIVTCARRALVQGQPAPGQPGTVLAHAHPAGQGSSRDRSLAQGCLPCVR